MAPNPLTVPTMDPRKSHRPANLKSNSPLRNENLNNFIYLCVSAFFVNSFCMKNLGPLM